MLSFRILLIDSASTPNNCAQCGIVIGSDMMFFRSMERPISCSTMIGTS